jgi:hypothetical protein
MPPAGAAGAGATATAGADSAGLPASVGSAGASVGVELLSRANMAWRLGGEAEVGSDAMTAYYL